MTQFEYVTVFVAILLALGVAELLAGLGRLIRERDHIRFYWVHVAWMFLAILAVTQSWWIIWNVRSHEFANFFEFLVLVLPRLGFVLVAFLLAPPIKLDQAFDLREYYFRQIRWAALLGSAVFIGIAFSRTLLGVERLLSPANGIRLVAVGFLVYLGFTKNPRVHEAAVLALYGLFSVFVAIAFFQSA